ncbi:TPA: replication initiator protein A [Streptococcus suis]|uniref:replication initiator protein A n=1 Tax=Streptococcus suis TaxID=1307 RepID=UPI0025B1063A|nr:replication initiator protein A [Streptococcus suis]MDN2962016.1 replication initiator protein A [Streptococcus suis]HEL1934693.1 replication initiator protein A [Streptococcus suis]HEL2410767.1 replication initiator protein A [Streptococcus suis]HEL2427192.1 replication initiator protein A [Streptococcus suis]HEL2439787.1 replication initiator protein A [Streptococcus suis]
MKRITANHYQTSERYYKLPKLLFESERYKDMKLEVKVAYAVLKDRLELSLSKGWIDEDGAIYLVYSNSKLMALLGCSKSKLLAIKKTLREYGLIDEVQQSSSEKGRLANKIYLGELEHEPTPVSNSDGASVQKTLGGCQNQPGPVLNSATSETEVSETDMSETKESESVIEDEEEKESQTSKKNDNDYFQRKVDRVTRYDRDYIWGLVHDQLRQVGLSRAASDYAMLYFDHRYQYALENMRFADRTETIAEYVFNGVLSEWTKVQRLKELKGGE